MTHSSEDEGLSVQLHSQISKCLRETAFLWSACGKRRAKNSAWDDRPTFKFLFSLSRTRTRSAAGMPGRWMEAGLASMHSNFHVNGFACTCFVAPGKIVSDSAACGLGFCAEASRSCLGVAGSRCRTSSTLAPALVGLKLSRGDGDGWQSGASCDCLHSDRSSCTIALNVGRNDSSSWMHVSASAAKLPATDAGHDALPSIIDSAISGLLLICDAR
mmetsp:Transcript_124178/g.215248  ORF Transcript_124178/g.215248 Transcript_124178/m.215248 type:complete len:216 (+) Transcript_124178:760-1407(+)